MTGKIQTFLLLAIFGLSCCNSSQQNSTVNETSESSEEANEWPAMDEFHMIMAESFHPYMDSGNLEPAKKNAEEIASMAKAWTMAPLPSRVDNENVKQKLAELVSESKLLVKTKNEGTDQEMGVKLNHLHDIFHEIQDEWYGQ